MFYLLSFLSLLIGVMIYLMDPVSYRQELDTRAGEAFIVGFINQHQAARDYMSFWLSENKLGCNIRLGMPFNRWYG